MQVKIADSDQRGGEHLPLPLLRSNNGRGKGSPGPCVCRFEEDRKLFVGMISRAMTEDQLTSMFEPFGAIEDLTILRNHDGTSRGCAFVKFSQPSEAHNAVAALHHNQTMEGTPPWAVVSFVRFGRNGAAGDGVGGQGCCCPLSAARVSSQ